MQRTISLILGFILLTFLWIDVFAYTGFTQTLIAVPGKVLLLASILLSTILYISPSKDKSKSGYIEIFAIGTSILYLLAITIEGLASQGYVYTLFHLRPESMFYPVFASVVIAIALSLAIKDILPIRLATYFLSISVCFYLLRQLPIVLVQSSALVKAMVLAPSATYDDKMRSQWGGFYDYMVYLKANLPMEGTTLGIPPQQNPWLLYGNGMLVQSFVYPTRVTNLDATGSANVMPEYIMQLSDWPPSNPALEQNKWGLIKL